MIKKNAIDDLFAEKIKEKDFPKDVVNAIAEIVKRNDNFPMGSKRRVSLKRTIEFIRDQFDYSITRQQIETIVHSLGRSSWAHE